MDDVVQRILSAAKNKGFDQKTLANEIGVRPQAITEWKKGITTSYNRYIPVISDLLGVSADYLLTGQESAPAAGDPELAAFLDAVSPLTAEERAKVQGFIQGLIAQRK